MSTPSMPETTTTFAAFPREIRDMIFTNIASAAEIWLDHHDSYHLRLGQYSWGDNDYTQCITTLHEWAPKSYIAKAACEVFWSYGTFRHGWHFTPKPIVDPRETLYIETDESARKPVGTPVDLRQCVQTLHLHSNPDPLCYAQPRHFDPQSLSKLKRELAQLHDFPRLRRVHLEIWIGRECDAYFEGMAIVESILEPCKELRARIGTGLKITLCRAWPLDVETFEFLQEMDVTWMWEAPGREDRECVEEGRATWGQYIRVLVADGVGSEAEFTLLEELRYAGGALPQEKEEILEMEAWEPWMGISEDEFRGIKERWGRDEEEIRT